jgi:hypothetical protein
MMRYHSRKGATLERLQTAGAAFASTNALLFPHGELHSGAKTLQ